MSHHPIYMNINNNAIKGESEDKNFQGQVELLSVFFGSSHDVRTRMGNTKNRTNGRPNYSPVIIKKYLDSASTQLIQKLGKGQAIPKVTISFANNTNEGTAYHVSTLKDVIIASHTLEHNASEEHHRPIEIFELNWASKEDKYTPYDSQNKAKSPSTVTVNQSTGDVS